MKKLLITIGVMVLLFSAAPVFAKADKETPKTPADYNGLNKGNSKMMHLYLYEKDGNWDVVEDGAWGKMNFDEEKFVFNGHRLEPNTEYALIVYDVLEIDGDTWPGTGPTLTTGYSDDYGDLHLKGVMERYCEAKIWLVLADDADGSGHMTNWNPTEYLFEYNRIPWACELELVETVSVDSHDSEPVESNNELEEGSEYLFVASGRANAGDTIDFDADFSITNKVAGDGWTDAVTNYESYGNTLLDLFVNDSPFEWSNGTYNKDHTYYQTYTGDGNAVSFKIYDVYYPNNVGELEVAIYKIN